MSEKQSLCDFLNVLAVGTVSGYFSESLVRTMILNYQSFGSKQYEQRDQTKWWNAELLWPRMLEITRSARSDESQVNYDFDVLDRIVDLMGRMSSQPLVLYRFVLQRDRNWFLDHLVVRGAPLSLRSNIEFADESAKQRWIDTLLSWEGLDYLDLGLRYERILTLYEEGLGRSGHGSRRPSDRSRRSEAAFFREFDILKATDEMTRSFLSRTSTTTGASTQNFAWDTTSSTPELLQDSTNAYVYGPFGIPFEQVNLSTGTIQYLVADALGSVRGVVSSSGTLTATTSYDAWGNPETTGGLSAYTPFGFTGGYTDPTGLIYFVNRYYDPKSGGFINVDPDLLTTGQAYSYAGDDPVNMEDPLGDDPALKYTAAQLAQFHAEAVAGVAETEALAEVLAVEKMVASANRASGRPAQAFTCAPVSDNLAAGYSPDAIDCQGGPLLSGSIKPGSTAAEARTAAEESGYPIPEDYVGEPAANGQGWVFRAPGTEGNGSIVRVGEPSGQNPTGYVRYYNEQGQPVLGPGSDQTGSNDDTHLPLNGDDGEGFDPIIG